MTVCNCVKWLDLDVEFWLVLIIIESKVNRKGNKMVRSLSQWTKTLSFPSRLSPNRSSKESVINMQPAAGFGASPTPSSGSIPRQSCSPDQKITEISQIVRHSSNTYSYRRFAIIRAFYPVGHDLRHLLLRLPTIFNCFRGSSWCQQDLQVFFSNNC